MHSSLPLPFHSKDKDKCKHSCSSCPFIQGTSAHSCSPCLSIEGTSVHSSLPLPFHSRVQFFYFALSFHSRDRCEFMFALPFHSKGQCVFTFVVALSLRGQVCSQLRLALSFKGQVCTHLCGCPFIQGASVYSSLRGEGGGVKGGMGAGEEEGSRRGGGCERVKAV